MAVYRNKKQENFTVLDNSIMQNNKLSWKAKGILTYLLSLPTDWDIHLKEIKEHATDGITSLRSGIKELREKEYIKYMKYKDDEGKFNHVYEVYEYPKLEKPDVENPSMDKPNMEKADINKEHIEQKTDRQNINKNNKPSDKSDTADEFSITKKDNGRYNYPDDFEKLYEIYPENKGTKKAGWRKWAATRRKGVSQKDLITAAENYYKVCKANGTDKKYIKHLSTFVGPDEHWKEYLEVEESELDNGSYKKAADFWEG